MSKYEPLQQFLESQPKAPIRLSIKEVEGILGFQLPKSARLYAAWWSNAPASHVQAQAWIDAGWETAEVDVNQNQKVTFTPAPRSLSESLTTMRREHKRVPPERPDHHPAFGVWKGLVTLLPDYDYTQPADPDWGKVYDE
jgi:hypothetical protein